ncbi:hypothetical protein DX927_09200 [Bacillus swezeyi]|uniref:Phage protein n=1 Tax=Bacillus swezeyi TaxID=1925020 RepID=A0A5M8RV53_9BACI|nr:hypothetical protein DX927_09200 [Bacillus swezeyi]
MNYKKFKLASHILQNAKSMGYSEQDIKGAVYLLHEEIAKGNKAILNLIKQVMPNKGGASNEHRTPNDHRN